MTHKCSFPSYGALPSMFSSKATSISNAAAPSHASSQQMIQWMMVISDRYQTQHKDLYTPNNAGNIQRPKGANTLGCPNWRVERSGASLLGTPTQHVDALPGSDGTFSSLHSRTHKTRNHKEYQPHGDEVDALFKLSAPTHGRCESGLYLVDPYTSQCGCIPNALVQQSNSSCPDGT
ncbi:hypothetical protein B0H34DRAFT_820031 [Crassisporium funariophilum]|nr:hypothetical protein B0H34DRAFT_820031 [Crassisporium funariophilum]